MKQAEHFFHNFCYFFLLNNRTKLNNPKNERINDTIISTNTILINDVNKINY